MLSSNYFALESFEKIEKFSKSEKIFVIRDPCRISGIGRNAENSVSEVI